jgi:putative salt-induced outer membrane protein
MNTRSISGAALLLLAPMALVAQTSADSLGWKLVANLGYVQTSGNTRLSTVNLGDEATFRASRRWTLGEKTSWVYGKSAGIESANQLLAGLRADYWINPRLSAFGTTDYEANPHAGIEYRLQELAGLGWKAIARPRQTLSIDLGAGVTQERTGFANASYAIARFAPVFRQVLRPHAYFEEGVEMTDDLQHTAKLRTTSTTTLVAPLTSKIGIRLSYLMRYDASPAPATPALKKLDTTFTSGIQITL